MAICSFVVRSGAMPMLAALLPQQEVVQEDGPQVGHASSSQWWLVRADSSQPERLLVQSCCLVDVLPFLLLLRCCRQADYYPIIEGSSQFRALLRIFSGALLGMETNCPAVLHCIISASGCCDSKSHHHRQHVCNTSAAPTAIRRLRVSNAVCQSDPSLHVHCMEFLPWFIDCCAGGAPRVPPDHSALQGQLADARERCRLGRACEGRSGLDQGIR